MFSTVETVLVPCGCVMAVHLLGQFCLRNGMIIDRWCGRLAISRSTSRDAISGEELFVGRYEQSTSKMPTPALSLH